MTTKTALLFSRNAPLDIWENIVASLDIFERYNLALTCKNMWEMIKLFPYPGYFEIEAADEEVGSFFHFNVQAVKIIEKIIDYDNLKKLLSRFHQLTVVDLTSIDITSAVAKKLIYCMPRYHRSFKVIVYVKSSDRSAFNDSLEYIKERRIAVRR